MLLELRNSIFNEIVKLYDFLQTIVLDKDVRFTSYF